MRTVTGEHPVRSFAVTSDSDIGKALELAEDMVRLRDVRGLDTAYARAVALAGGQTELRDAVAFDHVAQLWLLDSLAALRRCEGYLKRATTGEVELRALRAEILSSLARHAEAHAESQAVTALARTVGRRLLPAEDARLARVEAYWAATQDDLPGSRLTAADDAVTATEPGGPAALPGAARTVSGRLALARKHRRGLRYESALVIVRDLLDGADLEPGLRAPVRYEYFQLLHLTRQHDVAARLLPGLCEEAESSGDRELLAVLTCLSTGETPATGQPLRLDRGLECAAELVRRQRFAEAGDLLRQVRPGLRSASHTATWHLLSARIAVAQHVGAGSARDHLDTVLGIATPDMAEIRAQALRLAGELAYRDGDGDRALRCWAEAYALDDRTAGRQESETVRLAMMATATTQYDSIVTAAAAAATRDDGGSDDGGSDGAIAAIVVAMEVARDPWLLERSGIDRRLPEPVDLPACLDWVRGATGALPRSQAVWCTHVTPERIHHVLVARGVLRHLTFPLRLEDLTVAADRHRGCWSSPQVLEQSLIKGEFEDSLAVVAGMAGYHDVLAELPPGVRRIAVVPARELADLPLAAVRFPGSGERFVHRFAFSYLPSLSVRHHLRARARRQRGLRLLRVRPPAGRFAPAAGGEHTLLAGQGATVEGLGRELARRGHHVLRIDTHGRYDDTDPAGGSWLQLAPEGAAGRLTPDGLGRLDLGGCGTLVLGACESGRDEHRGRHARPGFARSALGAGAGAVVAARWVAQDATTAALLDRFRRHLRSWPRDVALQRAQVDACERARGMPGDVSFHRHPARWGCWALHGNPDHQTRAVSVVRVLRRVPNLWRRQP